MGVAEDIASFEQSLKDLVVRYEQYFLGMEKREPLQLLAEVEAAARSYVGVPIINTMWKFKYNATVARLNSYKQYWNRINRLIEEGKYSRDRFKMELHQRGTAEKQKEPVTPPVNREAEGVYRAYVEARKACNLPVHNVTPEMISSLLEKQKPEIAKKYGCERVEFQVVIEEGKPKIKAHPKPAR